MKNAVFGVLVVLLAGCGARDDHAGVQEREAPRAVEAIALPAGSLGEVLRGRRLELRSPAPHTDFNSFEYFACDGRWDATGGGENSTGGTYHIEGDRLCVSAEGGLQSCRRVVRSSDFTLTLTSEISNSPSLEYGLSSAASDCDDHWIFRESISPKSKSARQL